MQMRGVAIVAGACVALAVAAAPAASARAATCPRNGTLHGVSVLIECGPAKASVKFGATHLALKSGMCLKSSQNFSFGFGTIPAGPGLKRPPDSFQLIAGGGSATMHDGTYSSTVMVSRLGKNYIGDAVKVKLTRKETAGTFSGTVTWALGSTKVAVSGTFTC